MRRDVKVATTTRVASADYGLRSYHNTWVVALPLSWLVFHYIYGAMFFLIASLRSYEIQYVELSSQGSRNKSSLLKMWPFGVPNFENIVSSESTLILIHNFGLHRVANKNMITLLRFSMIPKSIYYIKEY